MATYRDELEALRSKKDKLEESLRDEQDESQRKQVRIDALEREVEALRSGARQLTGAPTRSISSRPAASDDRRSSAPPPPRTLRPDPSRSFLLAWAVLVVFCVVCFLIFSWGGTTPATGWLSLLVGAPIAMVVLYRVVVVSRGSLRFSSDGLTVDGRHLLRWNEIQATRVVALSPIEPAFVSVNVGDDAWHDLGSGYLTSAEELAELIDRWRAHAADIASRSKPPELGP